MTRPSIPKCFHQECDLVSLSVICTANHNEECPYAGKPEKVKMPCFAPRTA